MHLIEEAANGILSKKADLTGADFNRKPPGGSALHRSSWLQKWTIFNVAVIPFLPVPANFSISYSGKRMSRLFIVLALLLASKFAVAENAQAANTRHYPGGDSNAFAIAEKAQATNTPVTKSQSLAVSATQKSTGATQKPNANPYWEQPFDSSVASLDAPIMGNDIKQLYSKLVSIKSDLEQKKPETAEQNKDRISKVDQCNLGANLRCDSKLAFYERVVLDSNYDADSQTMAITFSLNDESLYSLYRQETGHYIIVEVADNTVSERYAVRNASGGSINILRTKGQTWALSIGTSDLESIISKVNDRYYECSINIKMPIEWVQEFQDGIFKDVGFLYIGTLDSDPAYEDKDYGTAMLGRPYAKDVIRYSIRYKLSEIWIVNKATGRIYGKHLVGAATNG